MLGEMTLQIAGMRAAGKTVAEIATELHLSRQQVGGHLGRWEAERKRRQARADKRTEVRKERLLALEEANLPPQETMGEFLLRAAHGQALLGLREALIVKAHHIIVSAEMPPEAAHQSVLVAKHMLHMADDIMARLVEYARMDENGRIA